MRTLIFASFLLCLPALIHCGDSAEEDPPPNQQSSNQDDPNQDAPNQDAPNQDDSNQDDSNQDDPNQDDPNQDDPNQDAPNQDDPDIPIGDAPDGDDELTLLVSGLPDQVQTILQGDTLTWEQGMQGGFHVWGAFELQTSLIEDLSTDDLDDLVQEYQIYDTEGELIATTNRQGFADVDGDTLSSGPFTVILRRSLNPNDTLDDPYLFELTVTIDSQIYEKSSWITFDCCHWL